MFANVKGLGVLVGMAVLIAGGVVSLAHLIAPDIPTFSESAKAAFESGTGIEDFTPTVPGGQLELTGAAEGRVALERAARGPTYGLESSDMKIFFEPDPLTISQMSWNGLAFFPEETDCEFNEGTHNEDSGLVAVGVACSELVDIRGNGTITLEGFLALPEDLVIQVDIPDSGGILTVGDEEWEIVDPVQIVGRGSAAEDSPMIQLTSPHQNSLWISFDDQTGSLHPVAVSTEDGLNEVSPDACSITSEKLVPISPQSELHEMTVVCEAVDVPGMGSVAIEGTVIYEKVFPEEQDQ